MALHRKKRAKSSRYRGTHTHGRGFKKKARGSGHRGGFGMAGTGKRGDQKKTMVLNLYGNDYFGKDTTLRRKVKPKPKTITIKYINENLHTLIEQEKAVESKGVYDLNLEGYKLVGDEDVHHKFKIKATAASKTAILKIKKAGGEVVLEEADEMPAEEKKEDKE
jgi:large subunit ribosomal protein L15